MTRMYDLLARGGYLVTTDVVDGYHFGVRSHLKGHEDWKVHSEKLAIPNWNPTEGYSPPPSPLTYGQKVLSEQGFEVIENKHWLSTYNFDNIDCSSEFTLAHDPFPHEENLSGEKQYELNKEVLSYLNTGSAKNVIGKTDDNKFQVKYGVVAALARKPGN